MTITVSTVPQVSDRRRRSPTWCGSADDAKWSARGAGFKVSTAEAESARCGR